MVVSEYLAQPSANVYRMRVFCSARDAEASAGPDAEVPGFAIERFGGLAEAKIELIRNSKTIAPRRHGDTENSGCQNVLKSIHPLQGLRRDYQVPMHTNNVAGRVP